MKAPDRTSERLEMVEQQIEGRGVRDPSVLAAMREVPRERFVPEKLSDYAYDDNPLPIGEEQTISQPYIVAYMVDALGLEGGEKVLEIGGGSGYAAAVLSRIAGEVYAVERIPSLAQRASETLRACGYHNVHVRHGDGTRGWPEETPFDAIVVAAGGTSIPDALTKQLRIGGRLVIPVGPSTSCQELLRVTRLTESQFKTEDLTQVRFVPLIEERS